MKQFDGMSPEEIQDVLTVVDNMEVTHEPSMLEWSLPRRTAYLTGQHFHGSELLLVGMFGKRGLERIHSAMADGWSNSRILSAMQSDRDMLKVLQHSAEVEANANMGGIESLLFPLRFHRYGGRHFVIRDTLNQQLEHTDIGNKAPMSTLKLPYPTCFIEFGTNRKEAKELIHNQQTGLHLCEGAFVREYIETNVAEMLHEHTVSAFQLDTRKPCRIIEMLFTGSPLGKSGTLMDDATMSINLFVQDEERPVQEVLEQHLNVYMDFRASHEQVTIFHKSATETEAVAYRWGVAHLAKCLLYINSIGSRRDAVNEYSELKEKIDRVAPKKRGKLEKRLSKAYDRIYVGAQLDAAWEQAYQSGSVKTHWRRGHYRNQRHGEGHAKIKVVWIKPVLVNQGGDVGDSPTYVVK